MNMDIRGLIDSQPWNACYWDSCGRYLGRPDIGHQKLRDFVQAVVPGCYIAYTNHPCCRQENRCSKNVVQALVAALSSMTTAFTELEHGQIAGLTLNHYWVESLLNGSVAVLLHRERSSWFAPEEDEDES